MSTSKVQSTLAFAYSRRRMPRSQRLAIDEAIAAIWTIVDELNGYITTQEPWVLAKSDETRARLGTVLYTASEGLRALAVLLSPVIPEATAKLWDALGAAEALGALEQQLISRLRALGAARGRQHGRHRSRRCSRGSRTAARAVHLDRLRMTETRH